MLFHSLRIFVLAFVTLGSLSFAVEAQQTATQPESQVAAQMTLAAKDLLATLSQQELAVAQLPFADTAVRTDWHYIPKANRKGLSLKQMNAQQLAKTHALVQTGLSQSGYEEALDVIRLESVLNQVEGKQGRSIASMRDPDLFNITIFGTPNTDSEWGWSFEGHHLSLNYVIRDGKCVASTPIFFGINPTTVQEKIENGPDAGTRVLAEFGDRGFELLSSLDATQKAVAVTSEKSISNVRGPRSPFTTEIAFEGIAAKKLTQDQQAKLRAIIEAYTKQLPKELGQQLWHKIDNAGFENIYFAWTGSSEPGINHHFIVRGPTFTIEYNNAQADCYGNPASHIHTVWREADGDFGIFTQNH